VVERNLSETPSIDLTSSIRAVLVTGSDEYNVAVSKVFMVMVPGKRVPLRRTAVRERVLECFRWRGSVPMLWKGPLVKPSL